MSTELKNRGLDDVLMLVCDGLRMRALTLSVALALQMTLRISTSKERDGTNSAQASDHSFTIAGYFRPHAS